MIKFDYQTDPIKLSVTVDDTLLMSLQTIFPTQLEGALDLCDHKSVTLYTSPSGRKMYRCIGSSGTPYIIGFPGYVCCCPSYKFNPITLNNYCKHLIAIQLSIAMGIVVQDCVSEPVMSGMIKEWIISDD